mgnify:FL=1
MRTGSYAFRAAPELRCHSWPVSPMLPTLATKPELDVPPAPRREDVLTSVMSVPRYDEDSDYGSDDEGEVSTVHLGLADGPLEGDDESNPLVSRIGGRPAWLPLAAKNLPPASLIECSQCKQPMELLVQIFAPLEDSPYDRNLLVWGCPLAECQRKAQGRYVGKCGVAG